MSTYSSKRQKHFTDVIHATDWKANVYSHSEKRKRDGFILEIFCILRGGNHDEVQSAVAEAAKRWYEEKGYLVEDVTTKYDLVASFWYPQDAPANARTSDILIVHVKMPTYEDLLKLVQMHITSDGKQRKHRL